MTLKRTTNNVKVGGEISEDFVIRTGLRQGDPLSTLLFNMILEKIIRDSQLNRVGHIMYKSQHVVAYAQDMAIIARNEKELKETRRMVEAAHMMGLQINQNKS